jgi:hypothetical protein
MSTIVRWVIGVLMILVGIPAAYLALMVGYYFPTYCTPPAWVNYPYYASIIIILIVPVISAVMLIRKAKVVRIVVVLVLGIILACSSWTLSMSFFPKTC